MSCGYIHFNDMTIPSGEIIVRKTISYHAMQTLRGWIKDGQWGTGEKLPGEMTLAERLQISRPTLRHVLKQLEEEGLVRTLPGRGRKMLGRIITAGRRHDERMMARTVGLLTAITGTLPGNPDSQEHGTSEYAIEGAMVQTIRAAGLHVLQLNANVSEQDLWQLANDRPHGIVASHFVAMQPQGQAMLGRLASDGISIVVTGNSEPLAVYDRAYSDHDAGAYELTRWLLSRGYRRIVEIGTSGADLYWVKARTSGHQRAMREAGLPVRPRITAGTLLRPDFTKERFDHRVRQITGFLVDPLQGHEPVDAVMAQNDLDALLIIAACRLLGRIPNQDVAIVGYDNYCDSNRERDFETTLPLATMDKRNPDVGREVVRLLLDRIGNKLPQGPQTLAIAPKLVVLDQRQ